jgi:putative glutamine amidotransferase
VSIRPLIGVSTSEVRRPQQAHFAEHSEPPRRELALGVTYLEAIERAGGMPVILAPLPGDAVDSLLDRLHGICLSGGPDLDPASYGGPEHAELGPTEPELDRFELALARRAQERGVPLLAICRGAQVLNVSRGGSLIQHLPEHAGGDIEHRQPQPATAVTHEVRIQRGSRLARLLGQETADVNSFHHQAVDRLGAGLRAVAWSPDGVVEAVEVDGFGFTVGVQWHAECLTERPEQASLFRAFVSAASRHEGGAFEQERRAA